jgi:two-component system response regulator MprA
MVASKRVLVVDDDESIRDVIQMILTAEGHDVVTACDGLAALDQVQRSPFPDLILLDMKMPRMDGWAFADAYRRSSAPRAPIIVLTAAQDAAARALQINADGYLSKPFDLNDLVECVKHASLRSPSAH